jgi:membrane-associated phospholipid phosphatase
MSVLVALAAASVPLGAVASASAYRWPRAAIGSPDAVRRLARLLIRHQRVLSFVERRLNPAEATGLVMTAAVSVAVGGAAAAGILLAMVHTDTAFARYDVSIAEWGAEHASAGTTDVLLTLTRLGGHEVAIVLSLVVIAIEWRRVPSKSVPWFLLATIGGVTVIFNAVKLIIARARPDIEPLANFSGASFPSGHAALAAATLAALALVLGRRRGRAAKAVLTGAAVGLAASVAASRALLGVHWFTDVLAGVAIGWGWFAVCAIAFGGRLLHFGAPVEAAERVEALSDALRP